MTNSINKIKWVITNTGLQKLSEATQDSSKSIFLPYIKFGDANGEYYSPTGDETDLKHWVHTSMVNKKIRSTTDEYTVIFSTEVNEDQGGFTVREIGLYGVDNYGSEGEQEYLFAVGTCEPFDKPTLEDDYVIYLTFDVCIRIDNLMQIYNQIKIDEASDYATKEDLDNIVKDMLYIEGNLMEQVNNNTKINGLSRVSQLYELINESVQVYNSIFSNFNYTALLSQLDIQDILGYWVFSYSGTSALWRYVPDLGNRGNFLSLSNTTTSFPRGYSGLTPYFDFTNNSYYKINADAGIDFCDANKDIPFTIFICASSNTNRDAVYFAKYNSNQSKYVFRIGKSNTNALSVSLFSNGENFVTFSSIDNLIKPNEFNVIGIRYNGIRMNPKVDFFLNGKNVGSSTTTEGVYTGMDYDLSTSMDMTSYLNLYSGEIGAFADAKIAQEIIINKYVNDNTMKVVSYNLMAMLGLHVCYRISSR